MLLIVVFLFSCTFTELNGSKLNGGIFPDDLRQQIAQLVDQEVAKRINAVEVKFEKRISQLELELKETKERLANAERSPETMTDIAEKGLSNFENSHIDESVEIASRTSNPSGLSLTKKFVVSNEEVSTVAFTVTMSAKATELGKQQIIPFDTILLNEGNAFDPALHGFTCPISGIYTFMTALLADIHENTVTEIVHNGTPLVQAYSAGSTSSHGFDQGFNAVMVRCNAGERVWVQLSNHQGTTVFAGGFSSFSGFLNWAI
ncbi:cerebellin-1-like [Mya arenaria]|uniref:cerebellin-1-like n=1 Tax=Mya arenaria TaxID=6604 RepID=UPI0022E13461|nr:cerebellin-1-like [Mya arenaria]